MKTSVVSLLVCLVVSAFAPVAARANPEVEKGARALAAELHRSWAVRDLNAYMACFGKLEGLLVWGGTSHTLDSMKARCEVILTDRTSESWKQDKVDVLTLSNNTALLQVTWSGRYTLKSGAIWEFKSTSFATYLIRKSGSTWKIVAGHESGRGTQVNAAKKKE